MKTADQWSVWLKGNFPEMSLQDRNKIVDFATVNDDVQKQNGKTEAEYWIGWLEKRWPLSNIQKDYFKFAFSEILFDLKSTKKALAEVLPYANLDKQEKFKALIK